MNATIKQTMRERRRKRIRAKISGTSERPRLSIFKSNTTIYAQIVDDSLGKTLASAKGADAARVGIEIGNLALEKKIKKVVFDRGGYIYTGNVRKLAESARKAGLEF